MSEERIESEENLTEEQNLSRETASVNSDNEDSLLKAKDEEIRNHIDRIQRLQADFENYKKRVAREHEALTRTIENRVYLKWLIIFDNFERAVLDYRENGDQKALAEGVLQIYSHFEDLLASEEIAAIDAVGKSFDPKLHEALMSVDSDEAPNTVLEEFERGFMRGSEVLRPSRVKVSKKSVKPSEDNSSNANGKGES